MRRTSGDALENALKLLETAARLKKDELKTVMSDKYTHLRSLVLENEGSLLKTFLRVKDNAVQAVSDAEEAGMDKARAVGRDVDKCVRDSPWLWMAGAAVTGLLLGFGIRRAAD